MALISQSGAVVVHNPVSYMFIGTGICPVEKLRQNGVRVALGTDGQAVSCGQEMVDVLMWTANLQKANNLNPEILSPEEIIQMATKNGAYAFGEPEQIGSLEIGKKAAHIIVDLDDPRMTVPTINLPSLLVNFAREEDVVTTIVNGKVLMKDKKILFLDEEDLVSEFKNARAGLLKRLAIY